MYGSYSGSTDRARGPAGRLAIAMCRTSQRSADNFALSGGKFANTTTCGESKTHCALSYFVLNSIPFFRSSIA